MNRNNVVKGLAATVAFAMLPLAAQAQEGGRTTNVGPYVGGSLGYNEVDDQTFDFAGTHTRPTQPTAPVELARDPNSGIASENSYKGNIFYQAIIGYRYLSGFRTEFELAYRQNDADDVRYPDPDATSAVGNGIRESGSAVKLTQTSFMLNLWYDLFPSSSFHPYLGGGAGLMRFKLNKQPTNRLTRGEVVNSSVNDPLPGPPVCLHEDCSGPRKADDARFAYQAGAGIRWDMLDYLTLGLDYRYVKAQEARFFPYEDQQATHLDSDYKAQSVMLSLNYFFNLPTPPPAPAAEPAVALVAPASICSDGQDNDGDGLVDFPADPGCSAPDDNDETDPPQCSDGKDNDGDGLIDFPNDKGCTGPEDNDETDPCKAPVAGERISLKGCGLGDVIVLHGVTFEFDKARLTPNARTILDNVAEELLAYPEITVELAGHTDARGSDDYNQALSDKRALAVEQYLVGKGVAADRMTARGYGESQPVADNESDDGRELNRRTELRITGGVAAGVSVQTGAGASAPAADVPAADAPPAEAAADAALAP